MNNWLATLSKNTLAVLAIGGGIFMIIVANPPHTVCDSQLEVLRESQKHFLYESSNFLLYKKKPKVTFTDKDFGTDAFPNEIKSASGAYLVLKSVNGVSVGDLVYQSETDKARVTSVDYASSTVSVDQSQGTWKPGSCWIYHKTSNITKYKGLHDECKASNTPGGCYELFQNIKVLLDDLVAVPKDCGSAAGGIKEVNAALWETVELLVRLAWGEKPPSAYNSKFGWLDTADITLFCKLKARISSMYGEAKWTAFREKMMLDLPGSKDLNRNQVWEMVLFSENCARYP
jgi:hypothetical protein